MLKDQNNVEALSLIIGKESARQLKRQYCSLSDIQRATDEELSGRVPSLTERKLGKLRAVFDLARMVESEVMPHSAKLNRTDDVVKLLRPKFSGQKNEKFHVVYVDIGYRYIDCELMSEGNEISVHADMRKVFASALRKSAAGVILSHNHPGDSPAPSEADISITKEFVEAGKFLGIPVIDHIIFGRSLFEGGYDNFSMKSVGHISNEY
jgi:DNA repair protein RadC